MIDHLGIPVTDYARSLAFYKAALAPLGVTLLMDVPAEYTEAKQPAAGFGKDKPFFWFGPEKQVVGHAHVAFIAASRAEVDAFYKAAIAAGGRDNGPPGPRPHYAENYYGAFVRDPDGHNIEAVHRG
ncbi:VOC family protein [Roseiterribacter gracilis]|uniref:Glyoxalase n=1 Tax=Roseiterribacter gracilis TaxID=2812848 RepID=A0A8S8XEN5_9PROT|nr:glyoxalase [Rhodospirillales bacterium TMPK1]